MHLRKLFSWHAAAAALSCSNNLSKGLSGIISYFIIINKKVILYSGRNSLIFPLDYWTPKAIAKEAELTNTPPAVSNTQTRSKDSFECSPS